MTNVELMLFVPVINWKRLNYQTQFIQYHNTHLGIVIR